MREQEAAARTGMPAQDRTFESKQIAGPQVVPKDIAPRHVWLVLTLVIKFPRHSSRDP
jgi:hypothetical protein